MPATVNFDISDETLFALRLDAAQLSAELRMAAAALFFDKGLLSQERAADLAGLPRAQFMMALAKFGISPFQESASDIREVLDAAR